MNDVVKCFEINQPMGTYYISKMTIEKIETLFIVNSRKDNKGVQRSLDGKRKKAISNYCEDPDAIFPTPIIFSIKSDNVTDFKKENGCVQFVIKDGVKASVVDGQHRIYGIIDSKLDKTYELPVVFMFDITQEEEAYIFSTINFNQKMVDKSLIYDLFDVYETRSPKKTCHEIAKSLNNNPNSALFNRLKVLGKKENESETLSQGTFAYHLLDLICPRDYADSIAISIKKREPQKEYEDRCFNKFFNINRDDIICKILLNYFNAVRNVFTQEWSSNEYILSKTIGYGGLMFALKRIYFLCLQEKNFSEEKFNELFKIVKKGIEDKNKQISIDNENSQVKNQLIEFKSDYFGQGADAQKKLSNLICSFLDLDC